MMSGLRWIPNAICIARILLVAPLVIALLERRFDLALLLIIVAGGSDGLDGFLAKTFDWRTRLGGLLDPLADKLLVTCVFITLTYIGLVPFGLTSIVIARDVVIVLGALAYQFLIGPVSGQPTLISKLNTASQLAFILLVLVRAQFDWPPAAVVLLLGAAVAFTSLTSGAHYVTSWSQRAWRSRHAAAPI